jgi:hypothetical protein
VGDDGKTEESIAQDIVEYVDNLYMVKFDITKFETVDRRYMLAIEFYSGRNTAGIRLEKQDVSIPLDEGDAPPEPEESSEPPASSSEPAQSSEPPESSSEPAESSSEPAESSEPTESSDSAQSSEPDESSDSSEPSASSDPENPGEAGSPDAPEGEGEDEAAGKTSWILWVVIGGVVLVGGVLTAVLLLRKKPHPQTAQAGGLYMKLEVLDGHYAGKADHVYLQSEILIGRGKECDIVFHDKDMSGKNARIFLQDNVIYIEDLNSKNGTALGGMKIYSPNRLRSGDVISVGGVRFLLKF